MKKQQIRAPMNAEEMHCVSCEQQTAMGSRRGAKNCEQQPQIFTDKN